MKISGLDLLFVVASIAPLTCASGSDENWNENPKDSRLKIISQEPDMNQERIVPLMFKFEDDSLTTFSLRNTRSPSGKSLRKAKNGKKCRKLTKLLKRNNGKAKRKLW
jgi:hypothetical protein